MVNKVIKVKKMQYFIVKKTLAIWVLLTNSLKIQQFSSNVYFDLNKIKKILK